MAPTDPVRPTEQDRLTRGRDLTDEEISTFLADRQRAIRHGTAPVGTEVAAQLRDRLAAHGHWRGWAPPWVKAIPARPTPRSLQLMDTALTWLEAPADPGTIATAQVFATLSVAAALMEANEARDPDAVTLRRRPMGGRG